MSAEHNESVSRITSHKIIDGVLNYRIQCADNSYKWVSAVNINHAMSKLAKRYFLTEDHELKDSAVQTMPFEDNQLKLPDKNSSNLVDLFADYGEPAADAINYGRKVKIDKIVFSTNFADEPMAIYTENNTVVQKFAPLSTLRYTNPRELAAYICKLASSK